MKPENFSPASLQSRMNEYRGCIVAIHPVSGGLCAWTSLGFSPNDLATAFIPYDMNSRHDMQIENLVDAFRTVITARLACNGGAIGMGASIQDKYMKEGETE